MADLYSRVMSRSLGLPAEVRYVDHKTTQTIQHTTFRETVQASVTQTKQWSPLYVRHAIMQHYQTNPNSTYVEQRTETSTEQRQSGQPAQVVIPQLPNNPQPTAQLLAFIQHTQPEGKTLVSDIVNTLTKRATEFTVVIDRGETLHFNATQLKAGLAAIIQKETPEHLLNTDLRQLLTETLQQQTQEDLQNKAQKRTHALQEQSTQQLIMAQAQRHDASSDNPAKSEQPVINGHFETDTTQAGADLIAAPVDGDFT